MQITAEGTITQCQAKRASSSPAVLWLTFRLPLDKLRDDQIAKLSRYVNGDPVTLAVDLGPFVAGGTGKSGTAPLFEQSAVQAGRRWPERVMPLPEERCARCGAVIGADPDRRFYTPLAGPPQPMHGACAAAAVGADVPRTVDPATEDAAGEDGGALVETGDVEVIPGEDEAAPGTMQPTAGDDVDLIHGGPESIDLLAPGWVPVPTERPTVAAVDVAPAAEEEGWAATTDPRPGGVADPEAAAALGETAPHLARVAAAVDEQFEALVGPSAAARRRGRAAARAGEGGS